MFKVEWYIAKDYFEIHWIYLSINYVSKLIVIVFELVT